MGQRPLEQPGNDVTDKKASEGLTKKMLTA